MADDFDLSLEASVKDPQLIDEAHRNLDRWLRLRRYREGPAEELRQFQRRFLEDRRFQVGDLVQWKTGMRNKTRPRAGEPAVVIEVLDQPVRDQTHDAGSAYFREPLDLLLGVIDDEGDFVIYHFDSRRFESFEERS